jgi:hypothetical protein
MTTHERIRRIFLHPSDAYSLSETAALLEYSHEQILAAVDQGDLSTVLRGDLPQIPWEEVALAAAERWSQETIEAALGAEVSSVVPELVRLTDLHVRVPRFGVLVLGRIAQRDGMTISDVLARQLLDLAVAESAALEHSVSGLNAAVRWPLS